MPLPVALFAGSIFASAFLIFAVQPMVGKHILPWFGGAPAVWMTCLAFYQTTLFLGYAYAHGLAAKIQPARQPWIHGALFLTSLAVLPVLPAAVWRPEPADDATWRILGMLLANVALPFMLLAATSPLLQVWFARGFPDRSPYPLYAVSNLGSLLGLVSFPFLVEPALPLSLQSRIWSWSFAFTGVAVLGCAAWSVRASSHPGRPVEAVDPAGEAIRPGRAVAWILFPASAVVMFMGVTNHLCLDLASVPFLWIVPLSIYLITIILCFSSERAYARGVFSLLALASLSVLALATEWKAGAFFGFAFTGSVLGTIGLYTAALFFGCMVAHGELYRLRPRPARLTSFYLCVAGGGALGGLFVGLVAPRVFYGYHELPIGVGLCWLLVMVVRWRNPTGVFAGRLRRGAWVGLVLLTFGGIASYLYALGRPGSTTLTVERSFFGILRVIEQDATIPFVVLRHGTTRHGMQYRTPETARWPASYYGRVTGIGLVFAGKFHEGGALRTGVVGLGVGTLSAYGRPGDQFVYYEIDPGVVRIAENPDYFTYLKDGRAETEIVLGDARLSLESELERRGSREFDLLVLDAFSGDAVPLHLLTHEAFQVYDAHLGEEGVLAVHVSNRNFDLTPLVARLGKAIGREALLVRNQAAPDQLSNNAKWMMLTRDPDAFAVLSAEAERLRRLPDRPEVFVRRLDPERVARAPLWTDDFSDVFGLLRSR